MINTYKDSFSIRALCTALGEPRASWYRSLKPRVARAVARRSPRRLSFQEECRVLETLNSERFRDMAPGEIYATLLDEGIYLCSERSMYRILSRHAQNRIRRQSAPREYAKPELLATRPNELWSWDITKLKGPVKWTYYYLYKIMDVFSRYVVGWMVAHRESTDLARDLIEETCRKQEILPRTLTVHADNGSSMKSKTLGQLLIDLGVTKTHSRPHVSNDNPFSESAFKTLKYRPDYPGRFGSIEDARLFCRVFFTWYNTEHRHSGIAMITPEHVHYNTHQEVIEKRIRTLAAAWNHHPERFVKGKPVVKEVPEEVWINKPEGICGKCYEVS
jgi:putative transposase